MSGVECHSGRIMGTAVAGWSHGECELARVLEVLALKGVGEENLKNC